MHARIVLALVQKDLRDAIRDGRVLFGLLLPLGLGLLYNVVMPEQARQTVTIAIASPDQSALPAALRSAVSSAVELKILPARDADQVRQLVIRKTAAAGLVIPAGFDAAIAAGQMPSLTVVRPAGSQGVTGDYLSSSLDAVLRRLAGQHPPAVVQAETAGGDAHSFVAVVTQLGIRKYLVLATLVMLVAMIAIYVMPVLLTEEAEKKTLNAVMMVGSRADVVAGKALVGIVYIAVGVPLLLLLTGLGPANPVLFVAAVAGISVTLLGFGLLLGALVRNMNQLNTWSSVPLMVLIMPLTLVVLDLPSWAQWLLSASPGNQALQLLIDSLSGTPLFGGWWLSFAVIGAWAVAGYALLLRTLARREG
jgi:ABC-2 type transport system permease protein